MLFSETSAVQLTNRINSVCNSIRWSLPTEQCGHVHMLTRWKTFIQRLQDTPWRAWAPWLWWTPCPCQPPTGSVPPPATSPRLLCPRANISHSNPPHLVWHPAVFGPLAAPAGPACPATTSSQQEVPPNHIPGVAILARPPLVAGRCHVLNCHNLRVSALLCDCLGAVSSHHFTPFSGNPVTAFQDQPPLSIAFQ